ncbi:MAG TPA: hypothetical protein VM076_04055 [Gemmatimonadaceae bacterium]|nr:hypothetical protein [Gemmatimonadaceae bacterium]
MTIGCIARREPRLARAAWALFGILVACDAASAPSGDATSPTLTVVGGNAQISAASSELAAPLVVRATNARGAPLAGVRIGWTVSNDGRLEPEKLVTDDSGLVRATWTLGADVGKHVATARVEGRVVTFRATAVEPLPIGAARRLRLATFDGSGEVVHPDVARVPRDWAPARRFLAITPYPGGNVTRELPSVYQSGDPTEWVAPDGLTNPVVHPWKGYLSDPDVVFEPQRRELWMYFRHVAKKNTVFLTVTPDGTHWSKPVRILSAPNHELVSPSVVRVGPNDWHMWSVNGGSIGCRSLSTTVEHRTSTDGLHWSAPKTVDMSGPDELTPWHVDVLWVPEAQEFWALYNEKPADTCATPALRLVTSKDGITWKRYPTPVLRAGVMPEFQDIVYRSTLDYDARTDMVTLWYSGARKGSEETWMWSAAVERRSRANLFRMLETPEPVQRMAVRRAPPILLDAP